MFGYVMTESARGGADRLLAEVALHLAALGWSLAGAVQVNSGGCEGGACDMDLRLLDDGRTIRISQSLGSLSDGCRLDPAGLEEAVGRVSASLRRTAPRLLIINKFGRQEAEGRGFCSVMAEAMMQGIPVLTGVGHDHADAFAAFADGMATPLPPTADGILGWLSVPA
jgi:hypothetical protein